MGSPQSSDKLKQQLQDHIRVYEEENVKSKDIIQRNSNALGGGTTRAVFLHKPFPLVFEGGHGPFLKSADGDEYLDFVSEYCAGMLGHSHHKIVEAIHEVSQSGFALGGPTAKEGELARLLVERFPSIDAIRFANSGTEANTLAIATALAHTRRKKVRKEVHSRRSKTNSLDHGYEKRISRWHAFFLLR